MEEQMEIVFDMKQGKREETEKQELIDRFEVSFNETGDPFVDAGGMALEYISKQFPDKSIMELIEWITEVFVKYWDRNLYNVFHTNLVKKLGTEKLKKQFENWVNNESSHSKGYCRICGSHAKLYPQTREFYPVSGSGTLVNFHHSHQSGLLLCANCSIKLFFLPFAILRIGKNLSIICGNKESQKYWKSVSIQSNLEKIGKGVSTDILHYKFNKLIVALFAFVTDTIETSSEQTYNQAVTLYEFNNFGSEPYMNIVYMNSDVIRFLNRTIRSISRTWYGFLSNYYDYANFDKEKQIWTIGKDKEIIEPEKGYIDSENHILNKLISGKSILSKMTDFYKKQINETHETDSRMAIYYAKEVIKMTTEQINLIKSIGNKIFELMKEEEVFKKYLYKMENAARAYQLRSAILNIIKKNYKSGNDQTIITLDQWTKYLFPDGQYWGEVRDLLLIFLYEKMHEYNHQIDIDVDNQIEETEENNPAF